MYILLLLLYTSEWEEEQLSNLFDGNFVLHFTQVDLRMRK